jgi:hypothetical protein
MHKRSRCSGFLRVFLVPIEYVWKRNIAKVVFKLLTLISPSSHSHNQPKGVSHILYTVSHILPQPEICNLTSEESQSVVLLLHFLKGTVSRDFSLLVFSMNQFPPSPWLYQSGWFKFLSKSAEIFVAQGAPPVSLTPGWQMEKIFNHKNFIYFFWTPLGNLNGIL